MLWDSNKFDVIQTLSKLDGVVFVGGVSLYYNGLKEDFGDIDICVRSFNHIETPEWHVFKIFDTSFYYGDGNRGSIKFKDYIVDIFIMDPLPPYEVINGYRIATVEYTKSNVENTLKFNRHKLNQHTTHKLNSTLDLIQKYNG